ncbi:hypothetical protein MCOR25_006104 [Pyricularia grisea]|uniref:CFEM domain-containing protein n=1 Tax=Pyricularia grisea TaxID=148305 RepID=A0A6P8AZ40_PYRGI|nr:hypothetical protein PgNI_10274 [Pyricularia grisea]KAI6362781.1 hypothetical protein MCOR25_006104 [Pyricularia grisea]TLD07607.1 hypothetical protein PgNI_10274 [Pyricularia grisea]
MKFSIILAAAATAVVAQDLSNFPSCAVGCIQSAIASSGCGSDESCQCGSKKAEISNAATPCLLEKCTNSDDLSKAATEGNNLCKNVTTTTPTTTHAGNSSSPATTKAASTTGVIVSNGTTSAGSPNSTATSTGGSRSPSGTSSGSPSATSATGSGAAAVTVGAGALLALFATVIAL